MSESASFADFVKEAREQKRKDALAQEILGRGRKGGAGSIQNTRNNSQKPSLLSRMSGVGKQRASSAKPNIDGKWKHDLHALNNPDGPPKKRLNRTVSASQIDRNTRTFDKFKSVVQNNARDGPGTQTAGFSIKGIAATGPWKVIASNFAPGTTAADIEAVMSPHGPGLMSCKLLSSTPTVMVEMIFDQKDDAENVIATFNNKKADGRLLYVYMKEPSSTAITPSQPSSGLLRSSYDDMDIDTTIRGRTGGSFQDGRFGFSERTGLNPPRGPRRRF
ncbi:hypothetical protein CC78DRAFT_534652 [Lojkania enalia]|uniref:RRM domain-containing protein n=1 Tax=Lojkania enalia TaxID=147567 RepID=A0A9P4K5P7_9PLEO|nr:hypothetical protein CC78DRAFT_534652 [Didymosphaeria enalia]